MEYIEKNRIINLLEHNSKVYHYADRDKENIVHDTVQTLCRVIIEAEAADVQPVKRGHWELMGGQEKWLQGYTCSECGGVAVTYECNFCPYCGADMRSEGNE